MLTNRRIKEIIREEIDEATFGNVDHFTPYSKEEAEQNKKAIGRVGNPSYDAFKKWREEGLRQGKPSSQLSWNAYKNNGQ